MRRNSRSRHWATLVVAGLLVLVLGIWVGGHPSWVPSPLRGALVDNGDGRLVHEALDVISHDYYRPLSRNQLVDRGLQAAVASLNDPFSHYFDPPSYREFLSQSNPHLNGVGIGVQAAPRGLHVVDVYPGGPAAHAGLQPGDVIVGVGATSLAGRSSTYAQGLIKGRPGTAVTLTIERGGHQRVFKIIRASLVIPVASGKPLSFHGVRLGYVLLTSFTQGSGDEIRTRVDKLLKGGARGIVLDLRQNGGGLLDEAVNVASVFIPDGTIVSTAGRSQPRQVYTAKGGAIRANIPMVVLVDSRTASAAEIVAGALQDRGRARVVGTHTYGKGVFQEVRELSNGGALDLTVGEYFTPSGHNLGGGGVKEGAGIRPDVVASDNPKTRRDEALDVALSTLGATVR
jgi:carboxyl-terminal processing protease